MKLFTRKLYDGMQPDSGCERRAMNEWTRRAKFYQSYLELIQPRLPASVRKLSKTTLHDSRVTSVSQKSDSVRIILDTRSAVGRYVRGSVELEFSGAIVGGGSLKRLVGCWWLNEEFHLGSDERFAIHVLLDKAELSIEAEGLTVTRTTP